MTKIPEYPGAGFIVFKKDEPSKILALVRDDGVYDIPKGRKDGNEVPLSTAKRECFEECSIFIEDHEILAIPPHEQGELTTYGAITDKSPAITPNIHNGVLEHQGYEWVNEEQFCSNCLDYLIGPVSYFCQNARQLI